MHFDRQRPAAGQGRDGRALQPAECAGVDPGGEIVAGEFAVDSALQRRIAVLGGEFRADQIGVQVAGHGAGVAAPGDMAAIKVQAVDLQAAAAMRSARLGGRRRGFVERSVHDVKLPVRRAIRPTLQQDIGIVERHFLDHHVAGQQRQQRHLGGQAFRGQHLRLGPARQVGQADVVGGDAGGQAQRHVQVATNGERAAGGVLDAVFDFGLQPLRAQRAAQRQPGAAAK